MSHSSGPVSRRARRSRGLRCRVPASRRTVPRPAAGGTSVVTAQPLISVQACTHLAYGTHLTSVRPSRHCSMGVFQKAIFFQ